MELAASVGIGLLEESASRVKHNDRTPMPEIF
jgi:hypothetical protein